MLLQSGRIKFQFLEYLVANPVIGFHELENLSYDAYRTMAFRATTSSSTVTPTMVAGIDFENKEAGNISTASAMVETGIGSEGEQKKAAEGVEKETEDVAKAKNVEDPGNARVVWMCEDKG